MSEIWRIPSPKNRGPKTTYLGYFRRLRNLTAMLTAYFGTKYDRLIHNRASVLETTWVSYIVSKCHELWSTNRLKLDPDFYPPFENSAFHFFARLRRRRSAKGTQPNFAKRRKVNRANNLPSKSRGHPSQKIGGQKFLHLFIYLQIIVCRYLKLFYRYLKLNYIYLQLYKDIHNYSQIYVI